VKLEKDIVSAEFAQSRVASNNHGRHRSLASDGSEVGEVSLPRRRATGGYGTTDTSQKTPEYDYDVLTLKEQRYLCQIPLVNESIAQAASPNDTLSKVDEEQELARANNRGWELLQEMQGQCIYFWSGWWSYRYCYGQGVKQFHQVPPRPGIPAFPPMEDPTITGFMLGSIDGTANENEQKDDVAPGESGVGERSKGELAAFKAGGQLETRGENKYLVQRLGGGTMCDLTQKERRIEVQVCHGNHLTAHSLRTHCLHHLVPLQSDVTRPHISHQRGGNLCLSHGHPDASPLQRRRFHSPSE